VRGGLTGANADKVREIYEEIVSMPENVRYNKPGLQAHIQYLAGMTTGVDQKIGRDAIERYLELKKQVESLKADTDRLLGRQ
jgi:hypothetical protein